MSSLNATPTGERIHIGIFGKRNAGKSSLINAITTQKIAIVSDFKGTTTDPVFKAAILYADAVFTSLDRSFDSAIPSKQGNGPKCFATAFHLQATVRVYTLCINSYSFNCGIPHNTKGYPLGRFFQNLHIMRYFLPTQQMPFTRWVCISGGDRKIS